MLSQMNDIICKDPVNVLHNYVLSSIILVWSLYRSLPATGISAYDHFAVSNWTESLLWQMTVLSSTDLFEMVNCLFDLCCLDYESWFGKCTGTTDDCWLTSCYLSSLCKGKHLDFTVNIGRAVLGIVYKGQISRYGFGVCEVRWSGS